MCPDQAKFSKYWLSGQDKLKNNTGLVLTQSWDWYVGGHCPGEEPEILPWEHAGCGTTVLEIQADRIWALVILFHLAQFSDISLWYYWKFRNAGSQLTIGHANVLRLHMYIWCLMKSDWGIWESRRCHSSVNQTVWVTPWATIHNGKTEENIFLMGAFNLGDICSQQ